jgi:hypothetical protein
LEEDAMMRYALLLGVLCLAPQDFVEVDYAKVERKIGKEPEYVSDPLYAMFILDPGGKFRVWAVLDRSKEDLPHHDVLYFDRNGNGDLTETGERFVAKVDESLAPAGISVLITVGDIEVPGTAIVHKGFRVSTVPKKGRKGIWFSMVWDGKEEISGGYGASGMDTTIWSSSPGSAPVLRPAVEGPLGFAIWGYEEVVLGIGESTHISLLVGSRGSGPDTLCALNEDFLDLEKDRIRVTLIAKDEASIEIRSQSWITGHC